MRSSQSAVSITDGSTFEEIEFNKPLKSIPGKFRDDVVNFLGYLSDTATRTFKIKGFNKKTGEHTEKSIPYIHRWTDTYKKSIMAKLYKLEAALGTDYSNMTMVTLTTYQKGFDPEQCLLKLVEMRKALLKLLRYHFGTTDYLWILENHKTGYPHLHMAYSRILSEQEQEKIRSIWVCLYGMGDEKHGVKFSLPRASNDGHFEAGTVGRIRGYLLKYLKKGLGTEMPGSGISPKKCWIGLSVLNRLLEKMPLCFSMPFLKSIVFGYGVARDDILK
ncbi:MAG: hypothetical protein NHB15_14900 [Methanosarcina barkeri]|nr:hypothetical protein [Methanosarcina sp. ERenArc_MAG2]